MDTPWSNPWVLQKGQWLTYLDKKDTYCHIGIHPADICYLHFCHDGTAWQFIVLSFGLSTSLRVSTKNTQTSTSLFPFAWGQAIYVSGRLDSSSISDKNSPGDDEGPPNCWFCWYYDHDPGKCHKHGNTLIYCKTAGYVIAMDIGYELVMITCEIQIC